jgi:hypothetical protein
MIYGMVMSGMPTSVHAADSQPLEAAMTEAQFRQAGLHRLNNEELAFLNQWLGQWRGQQPTPEGSPGTTTEFGAEHLPLPQPATTEPTQEHTTVSGSFRGWSGRTVFTLANGQVWQQRLPGKYFYKAENPEVILIRGRFGYYLQLVASGRQIAVKRLK